ncbi:MAG: SMC-Scp complex subunit ScpB [Steroidobacteraceae bacterium]
MSDGLKNIVEAALLAAGRTLSVNDLMQLFDLTGRPGPEDLGQALASLAADYEGRGIELKETAAGFRIQVRRELSVEISRLWPERPQRYSRALLETLALIAYRQPLTRAEIEGVRGVAVNPNIIKTLLERAWIRVVGHRDLPGHPELLGTTREFLDYFGLRGLEELPPLAELKSLSELEPQMQLAPVAIAAQVEADDPDSDLPEEEKASVPEAEASAEVVPEVAVEAEVEAEAEAAPESETKEQT